MEPSSPTSAGECDDLFSFHIEDYEYELRPPEAREKHKDIIAAAVESDLSSENGRQQFCEMFGNFFNSKGTQDHTILHTLAGELSDKTYQQYIPLIDLLLEKVPDLPLQTDEDGKTVLHMVVEKEHSEVAKFFCGRLGYDPQLLGIAKKGNDTCLHIAIRKNLPCVEDIIRELVAKNAGAANDILQTKGSGGNTPLHIAVEYERCTVGQDKFVALLLNASSSALDVENERGILSQNSKMGLSPLRYHQETTKFYEAHNEKKPHTMIIKKKEVTEVEKVQRHSLQNISKKRQDSPLFGARQRPDPATAKKVEDMLLEHCLRNRPREVAIKILYGPLPPREIHFDLVPRKVITLADLDGYAGHLRFESVLQYVAIPKLEVKNYKQDNGTKEPYWHSAGRKDYLAIFNWLREKEVKRILRVYVEDDLENPHSEEAVLYALRGLEIEVLDWSRFDLCSDVLVEAVPNLRKLRLYCRGNNAVLRSWSSPSGLPRLSKLQKVHVEMHLGFESRQATEKNLNAFKRDIQASWQESRGRAINSSKSVAESAEMSIVSTSIIDQEERKQRIPEPKKEKLYEQRQRWMDCMKSFADFIRNYSLAGNRPVIKVGLIDDGVDGTYKDLNDNIKGGQTFSPRGKELWNSYYHSSTGHGTTMAYLIRRMCPNVHLYVGKLAEHSTEDGSSITVGSAIKALHWAVEMGVHVISMSWTIEKVDSTNLDRLRKAISAATSQNILLFCASDDQGNTKAEVPYPAKCDKDKIFRIGAASSWGRQGPEIRPESVEYIFPGDKSFIPDWQQSISSSDLRTASSLATALASGLAAVILYCAALRHDDSLKTLRSHEKMRAAFDNIGSHNGYLYVWRVFEEYVKDRENEDDESKVIHNIVEHLLRLRP